MSDVGKRPTKPGQMVMIVGARLPENQGITGVTLHRIEAGGLYYKGGRCLSAHWVCEFSRLPVVTIFRCDGSAVPNSSHTSNFICESSLIVIADPDIDTSETEELNQPEGIAA